MTTEQIQARIDLYNTAIENLLLTGQKYSIGTGPSTRSFEMADIGTLEKLVYTWEQKLNAATGNSGAYVGF